MRKPVRESAEDADELVGALLTASRVLVGVSARSLAAVEDKVTLTQFRTLVVLHGHGATRLNSLADRIGVQASTALRSVDRMVSAGYVQRRENPRDRREVALRLTPAGVRLVDRVTRDRRRAISRVVAGMPHQRRSDLVAALRAFSEAAQEPAAADEATRLGW